MAASFHFEHSIPFSPENAAEILRAIPALPGVFALHGPRSRRSATTPSLTSPAPPTCAAASPASSRRRTRKVSASTCATRVARIDYTVTGSEFESTLTLYHASVRIFGLAEARRRLRLHTPFFLRFTAENAYPRVYSTNRLSRRALAHTYGPFPSRAAADRYCDAVLDLFKLRRCYEDLAPYPEHPGCVYQEMNKCLAPCNQACTPAGRSRLRRRSRRRRGLLRHPRRVPPHAAHRRARAAPPPISTSSAPPSSTPSSCASRPPPSLADPLVQPIPNLRAVIVQKAAQPTLPLLEHARRSIELRSLLQSRNPNPPPPSSSSHPALWSAQRVSASAAPTERPGSVRFRIRRRSHAAAPKTAPLNSSPICSNPRQTVTPKSAPDLATLSDHLSLLRRWYYRPEKQRTGEVFFPKEGSRPIKPPGPSAASSTPPPASPSATQSPHPKPSISRRNHQSNQSTDTLPPAHFSPRTSNLVTRTWLP